MDNENILCFGNFCGRILESQSTIKRFQAIIQFQHIDRLYSKVTQERLTRELLRIEHYHNADNPPAERQPLRNPNYASCFEDYLASLPADCKLEALKKLTVIVGFISGSVIGDLFNDFE